MGNLFYLDVRGVDGTADQGLLAILIFIIVEIILDHFLKQVKVEYPTLAHVFNVFSAGINVLAKFNSVAPLLLFEGD